MPREASHSSEKHPQEDPILHSARREAIVVFGIWLSTLAYTTVFCGYYGYDRTPESITYYWGIPDWVMWGVFAPWFVCFGLSFWFSFFFMQDADLGAEVEEEESPLAKNKRGGSDG